MSRCVNTDLYIVFHSVASVRVRQTTARQSTVPVSHHLSLVFITSRRQQVRRFGLYMITVDPWPWLWWQYIVGVSERGMFAVLFIY
jgi:hypothetical protein